MGILTGDIHRFWTNDATIWAQMGHFHCQTYKPTDYEILGIITYSLCNRNKSPNRSTYGTMYFNLKSSQMSGDSPLNAIENMALKKIFHVRLSLARNGRLLLEASTGNVKDLNPQCDGNARYVRALSDWRSRSIHWDDDHNTLESQHFGAYSGGKRSVRLWLIPETKFRCFQKTGNYDKLSPLSEKDDPHMKMIMRCSAPA